MVCCALNFMLLLQFMGTWYEIAVVSTCPHYMRRKSATPVMAALELQHVPPERNFTMTGTSFRSDMQVLCRQLRAVLCYACVCVLLGMAHASRSLQIIL